MKEIRLTKNKVTIVDDENYKFLNQWKWYASENGKNWYAQRNGIVNGKRKTIKMHRLICDFPIGMVIDHKDRNGLNNQKNNLKICTQKENCNNIFRKKNVGVKKEGKKWVAKIIINVGRFDTEEDAIKARIKMVENLNCEI